MVLKKRRCHASTATTHRQKSRQRSAPALKTDKSIPVDRQMSRSGVIKKKEKKVERERKREKEETKAKKREDKKKKGR